MADDRWWRDVDTVVLDELAAGSRVLDVGCGDGGLVDRFAASGLDAVGVDPRAPMHPRLMRQKVEDVDSADQFDAICAVMALHHAQLELALPSIVRLLRPGGRLFVYEFAWESYDERAASWLAEHDRSDADHSVTAWRDKRSDLHTDTKLRAALGDIFDLRIETERPYLARMLGNHELEQEEQALIDRGALPALGRWYVAGPS